ncbi:ABC transporter permease [Glycomyces sp. A-F 0318]|uniref:ABC transporter permease n=1 Tax=Glycomyces amatae TaxID=2881355 RepID=UPI001E4C7496|nr:ABC transporter permease [Glycomyces amatae]MCD0444086.1 ABC transporter permease [Glycomyces amatae]
MSSTLKLVQTEARLFLRDPMSLSVGLLLPTVVLIGLGAVPMLREPSAEFGGVRFIDYFAPSLIVMCVGVVGLTNLPVMMATYREQGVLRRMRTTPVHPGRLLLAQLLVNLGAALVSTLLVVAAGRIAYGVPLPENPLGFAAAFLLGIGAVFAIGMLVAALAPTIRAATSIASVLFMAAMFFGGVYIPRFMLPDAVVRIGDYMPPGVQALLDTWDGAAPSAVQLLVMGATAVVAGVLAGRMFRWE